MNAIYLNLIHFFFDLIALARNYGAVLKKSDENEQPCLVSDLWEKAFSLTKHAASC